VVTQEKEHQWDQEKGEETAEHLAPRFLRASALVWQAGLMVVHWLAPVLAPPLVVARLAQVLAQALVGWLVVVLLGLAAQSAKALQKALA
jgi:Ca2+/H+ antiporter